MTPNTTNDNNSLESFAEQRREQDRPVYTWVCAEPPADEVVSTIAETLQHGDGEIHDAEEIPPAETYQLPDYSVVTMSLTQADYNDSERHLEKLQRIRGHFDVGVVNTTSLVVCCSAELMARGIYALVDIRADVVEGEVDEIGQVRLKPYSNEVYTRELDGVTR